MNETFVGLGFIATLFLVMLAILWFFLPFAIFGTKDLIEQQIKATKETNALLKQLLEASGKDNINGDA